ncbi:MAG: hypothetical protein FDZ75_03535 [Actinobacteria bacterium]|nr:MAG: hypothetical protein FDZ75_03535 [Actinomycetota bacterium]
MLGRKTKLGNILVATAVVLMMVPAVYMVGCSMPMVGNACTAMFGHVQTAINQACDGTLVTAQGPAAVLSAGLSTLLFALALALAAGLSMLFEAASRPALVPLRIEPPPPPEDPLGTRLTL